MKLRHILYLLLALPLLLTSCEKEDDVNEIFVSGTWNVGNFYHGGQWSKYENDGAKVKYTREEDIKALNAMTITFNEDGSFQGKTSAGPFTGKWAVDGKKRTISITQLRGNVSMGKSKEFIDALKNAAYYKGDSNYLKLAPEDKKSYVQLGHYSK